jgi:DNA-directed RNA polymerase subunit K/omega
MDLTKEVEEVTENEMPKSNIVLPFPTIDDSDNEESELDSDVESVVESDGDNDDNIDEELVIGDDAVDYVDESEFTEEIDTLKTNSTPFIQKHMLKTQKFAKKTVVIKDSSKFITNNLITKYELCRVISERSNALEHGAQPLIDVTNLSSYQEIALQELKEKKCPLFVYRPIPHFRDIVLEKWDVNDLLYLQK